MSEQHLLNQPVNWYFRSHRQIWEGRGLNMVYSDQQATQGYVLFIWPNRLVIRELCNCDVIFYHGAEREKQVGRLYIPPSEPFRLVALQANAKVVGELHYALDAKLIHGVLTSKGPV